MYCIPPPLPPPVRPSVRVATARSGLESDLAFPRHFYYIRRYSLAQTDKVAHPTGGWSVAIFAAERHIQKKRKKRKYGSLCLDAHKFRTPLVLRYMALLHSTTPQTCTTLLACTCYILLLRRQRCRMFQIQDVFVSLAVPCSYPRHT